ncbi:CD36 antigen family-containing protein [Aphelenchoides bicaudatus]|nr:CD36 antigen family-containing protein [Aphelenchoides bicaudatus]
MIKKGCRLGCAIFFLILALISLAVSLFLWFGFDSIYNKQVDEQLTLKQEEDGQLTKTTFFFMHPPADALSHYYIFNVNNTDAVEFFGATPELSETGPFVVRVNENKWNYTFINDSRILRYQNYKTYQYEPDLSCGDCTYDTIVTIPNLVGIGTLEELLDPKYRVSPTEAFLIDLLMLLVGEYPFVRVRFGDLLFDGYEDPMLTAAHSEFLKDLAVLNGSDSIIPVPVPDMTLMAFFFHYNNTNDETYEVWTGKGDVSNVGQIYKWADNQSLPELWWNTTKSRQIRGSDSGGLQKSKMSKDEPISLYQSFMCRSFDVSFKKEDTFRDLKTYRYEGGLQNYNTSVDDQEGFRYKNSEIVNYYPKWPACPNIYNLTACSNKNADCALPENMCTPCCNGSFVDGTHLLPPAMYPINCYPGRVKETPFRLLFTTPHFAGSPPEVIDSIGGMKKLGVEREPFSFNYVPRTGACVEANIRFQVAIPVYQTSASIMASQLPNKILPVFWVDNAVKIKDNLYSRLRTGFVIVPKLVTIFRYVTLGLFLLFLVVSVIFVFYRKPGVRIEIASLSSRL